MKSFIQLIQKKIKDNLEVSKLEIIDNSFKHINHKSFKKDKFHLKIIIESEQLKSLNKVQAHQRVMNYLKDEIKEKIHALELKIN